MSIAALGAWRARYEIRAYFRSGDTLFFTFLFPIAMLALFSVIFGADGDFQPDGGVPVKADQLIYVFGCQGCA